MSEHNEQAMLFQVVQKYVAQYPVLKLLHAIPNGGIRPGFKTKNKLGKSTWFSPTAKKLKAEGVRSGIPDIFLPVARPVMYEIEGYELPTKETYHGYYLEMKFGKNKLSDNQVYWIGQLEEQGYKCEVHYTWQAAWEGIKKYLGIT